MASGAMPPPPSAAIDWTTLGFDVRDVNGYAQAVWRDGRWDRPRFVHDHALRIHGFASALNYGQQCFEGVKAFRGPDGRIRLFRPRENAARMAASAAAIDAPPVPAQLFLDAVHAAVRGNFEFVPPNGQGSLYVRPLLLGTGANIGLSAAPEFTFLVMVTPVGNFYPGGAARRALDALIAVHFDRASPRGTGRAKVGGNYAPVFLHSRAAAARGFGVLLHVDAQTQRLVEEFSSANFIAVRRDPDGSRTYVTPDSTSVLQSITNRSLAEIAATLLDMRVEVRPVAVDELPRFDEVMACGTAAVVTPIRSITHGDNVYRYAEDGEAVRLLFDALTAIQEGRATDRFGWMEEVEPTESTVSAPQTL